MAFFVVAILWIAAALVAVALGRAHVLFIGLALLVVPVTAAMTGMAVRTVRGRRVGLRDGLVALRRRWPLQWAAGLLQGFVFVIAWVNVEVARAGGRTLLVLAAIASVNIAVAVAALSIAFWPLLLDPARESTSVRTLLRLTLGVVALRPGRILFTLLFGAVAAVVAVQTVVFAIPLVALTVLLAVHVTIPAADQLRS